MVERAGSERGLGESIEAAVTTYVSGSDWCCCQWQISRSCWGFSNSLVACV